MWIGEIKQVRLLILQVHNSAQQVTNVCRYFRVRVRPGMGPYHAPDRHSSIDLRSRKSCVSEQTGDSLKRRIVIVHMGGEGVSKQVRMVSRQAFFFGDVLYYPADGAHVETFRAAVRSLR